jgi:Acetyl-CoA hydrolase/transferase N-terminal domain
MARRNASTFTARAALAMREPFHPIPRVVPRAVTAEAAVGLVRNGDTVFVHTGCAAPHALMTALAARGVGGGVRDVTVIHNLCFDGSGGLLTPEATAVFRHKMHFVGSGARAAVAEGRADYVPLAFGELPELIRRGVQRVDAALINVSPPDRNGFCTLGISVEVCAGSRVHACLCARACVHACVGAFVCVRVCERSFLCTCGACLLLCVCVMVVPRRRRRRRWW